MGKIFKYLDKPLLIATILLFIFGLIMVFSASNVTAYMQYAVSPYHYFINQLIFLVIGLVGFLIMIRFSTKAYGIFSWILMFSFVGILAILLVVGKAKNQAVSWFDFGAFNFQPSEFIKVITIIFLAHYYNENRKKLDDFKKIIFSLGLCGSEALLIALQPDLGTAVIYTLIVVAIFFVQPLKLITKLKIFTVGTIGIVLVAGILMLSGHNILLDRQQSRIDNMRRPCDRLLTDGNQVCNGYIAMNNGGLLGKGLGNSTQKYLYLPEPYTDFIFTIMIEELGLASGIVLLLFYIFVLFRILVVAKNSYSNRGASICYGVFIYILLHISVNLLGVEGLIPMTGVPLPFISYGGSFTICLIAALTAVQRVNVETNMRNEKNV